MIPLAVAVAALKRLGRDRTALFFLVVLPIVIMIIIGTSITGEQRFRIGLVGGSGAGEPGRIAAALRADGSLRVRPMADRDHAETALRRGEVDTVVLLPADAEARLRAGRAVPVQLLAQQTSSTQRAAATAVGGVLADHDAVVVAARVRASEGGGTIDSQFGPVGALAAGQPPLEVHRTVVDSKSGILPGGFSYSTPTMLVLFVFMTAVTGSGTIIESRRLGIHDRALAGPVTPGILVAGETLALLAVVAVQAGIIVGVGTFVFGVSWGDPAAAVALVLLWTLVATGAGVLAGTLFRTSEQSTSIGVTAGMAMGMLGGCMWPLEIVPAGMRTLGHLVPHAWAIDGWIEVLSRGGGLGSIAPQLGVLAGFAVILLGAATLRLRARLSA